MSRKHYPRDISREQLEQIRPFFEGSRKRTSPRKVDLYDIFCEILYLLSLPGGYSPNGEYLPDADKVCIAHSAQLRHGGATRVAVHVFHSRNWTAKLILVLSHFERRL